MHLTCCDLQAVESCVTQTIPPLEIETRLDYTELYRLKANSIQDDKKGRTIVLKGGETVIWIRSGTGNYRCN